MLLQECFGWVGCPALQWQAAIAWQRCAEMVEFVWVATANYLNDPLSMRSIQRKRSPLLSQMRQDNMQGIGCLTCSSPWSRRTRSEEELKTEQCESKRRNWKEKETKRPEIRNIIIPIKWGPFVLQTVVLAFWCYLKYHSSLSIGFLREFLIHHPLPSLHSVSHSCNNKQPIGIEQNLLQSLHSLSSYDFLLEDRAWITIPPPAPPQNKIILYWQGKSYKGCQKIQKDSLHMN